MVDFKAKQIKFASIVLVFMLCCAPLSAMIRSSNESQDVVNLPADMINSIIKFSCLSLELPEYKEELDWYISEYECDKVKTTLPSIAQRIIELQCVNKQVDTYITSNLPSLLCLNKNAMDTFLIKSVYAKVPYFIKKSIEHGASCDAVYKPNGFTALLYAIEGNDYHACSYLLSKGADINLIRQKPEAVNYSYHPHSTWPIHHAIKKGDAKLVGFLVEKGAKLNVRIHNNPSTTLLSSAVYRNEPAIMKVLLDSGIKNNFHDFEGNLGIISALYDTKFGTARGNQQDRKQIVGLLEQAYENLNQEKFVF